MVNYLFTVRYLSCSKILNDKVSQVAYIRLTECEYVKFIDLGNTGSNPVLTSKIKFVGNIKRPIFVFTKHKYHDNSRTFFGCFQQI